MLRTAKGTFEITMTPAPAGEGAGRVAVGRVAVGRMLIDKQYAGDFIGVGQGEMLSAGNPGAGSAGYVAMEHVTGAFGALTGSFALQHAGTIHGGESILNINVVPGSGTGELAGISGKLKLDIVGHTHHYELEYTLG